VCPGRCQWDGLRNGKEGGVTRDGAGAEEGALLLLNIPPPGGGGGGAGMADSRFRFCGASRGL
jgi:hypothetical protein